MAANVITALNLRIGFDVSEFETRSRDMRQSIARTKAIMRSMEGPSEKLANDVTAVTTAAAELGLEGKELELVLDKLAQKYDVTGQYARANIKAKEELAAAAKQEADAQKKLTAQLSQSRSVRQKIVALADQAGVGLSKLAKEQAYYNKALQQGLIDEREHARALQLLNKIYIETPALVKAAADAEKKRADAAKAAADAAKKAAAKEAEAQKRVAQELAKSREVRQRIVTLAEQAGVGLSKLAKEQAYYNKALEQGRISEAEHVRAMQLLNKVYVETPALAKAAADAEKRRAEAAKEAADAVEFANKVIDRAGVATSQYEKEINRLFSDLRGGRITLEKFQEALAAIDEHYVDAPARIAAERAEQERLDNELKDFTDRLNAVGAAYDYVNKLVDQARGGTNQYELAITRLFDEFQNGNLTLDKFQQGLAAADEFYVDAPARAKATADAEKRLNDARSVAAKYIQKEVTAADRYKEVYRSLVRLRKAKEITNEEFRKGVALARKDVFASKMQAAQTDSLSSSLKRLAATYVGFQTLRAGVKIAADMEQAKIAFEVMAGSAEEGKRVLTEVRDFAARTPITFEGAQKSAKTLMQFGVESDKVSKTLKMLGDVAAGDTQRLEHLSLAFGQVVAAGRLTGQETLQMVNSGFNPLKQIAEDMAKEFGGLADHYFPMLKKQMEQGNISAEMVAQAIESATSAGGRFAGMTDRMGETAGGAYNQLIGAAQNLADTLGEYLLPVITDLLHGLTGIVQVINETIKLMDSTAMASLAAAAGMVAIIGAVYKVIQITKLLRTATIALNVVLVIRNALSGPAGWAILAGAAVAATAGIIAMKKASEETAEELKKEEEAITSGAAASEEYKKSMMSLTQATSAADSPIAKITADLQKQYNQLTMTAEQFRAYELSQEGLNATEVQSVLMMERRLNALKESKEIQEMFVDRAKDQLQTEKQINDALQNNMLTRKEAATKLLALEDKRLEKIKELADAGKSIQEKYNPVAKVAEQLAQLNTLLATGNITQEQFFRERNKMLFDNIKKLDMTQPEAMEAGSAQAAQFMQKMVVDEAQQQIAELQAQTLLQQASLQAQQETNRRLAELKPVQLIRS